MDTRSDWALLNPVGWLTDSIVNAAQQLLKKLFPSINSLQDVAIGYTMNFEIQTGKYYTLNRQSLADNFKHWKEWQQYPRVNVFDSSYPIIPTTVIWLIFARKIFAVFIFTASIIRFCAHLRNFFNNEWMILRLCPHHVPPDTRSERF